MLALPLTLTHACHYFDDAFGVGGKRIEEETNRRERVVSSSESAKAAGGGNSVHSQLSKHDRQSVHAYCRYYGHANLCEELLVRVDHPITIGRARTCRVPETSY